MCRASSGEDFDFVFDEIFDKCLKTVQVTMALFYLSLIDVIFPYITFVIDLLEEAFESTTSL